MFDDGEGRVAAFRSFQPPADVLWARLQERLDYWTENHDRPVGLTFDAEQWRESVAREAARRGAPRPTGSLTVDDVDWQAIDDALQEAVDGGYPWVGLRDHQLVGLVDPGGEPWTALPDPADGTIEPGGAWSPAQ